MSMKCAHTSLATTPAHKDFSDLYLDRLGVASVHQLGYEHMRKYFLLAVKDFLSDQICLEQLAGLATEIWSPPEVRDDHQIIKLKSALEACSELPFYLRKISTTEGSQANFLQFFAEVMQYYQENKHLI